MTTITVGTAVAVLRDAAKSARERVNWNYDHAENAAASAVAEALEDVADAFAKLSADPEPYVGQSGRRYDVDGTTWASLHDGPLMFEPRPEYGDTEDTR